MSAGYASHAEAVKSINLANRFDRLPMTWFQNKLYLIIATAWLFDSIDLGGITFLLPTLREHFHLSTVQAGLVGTMGFVGMFFGAAIAGMLADRFGRKVVFQVSMLIWGTSAIMLAFSQGVNWIYFWRFVLGFGMGAEYPIALAIVSEFIPTRVRGRYVTILEGFWPLGFILAGIMVALLLPYIGWRGIFLLEGLPAFWVFIIRKQVPESPRWYESVKRYEEADQTMKYIEKNVEASCGDKLPEPTPASLVVEEYKKTSFAELWSKQYAIRTFVIWSLWGFCMYGYYALTTWLSALLVEQGYTIASSVNYTLLISLAGIPGFIVAAWLVEKIGRKPSLIIYIGMSAVSCLMYGRAPSLTMVIAWGLCMQFFMFGMWCLMYAYTPELYPTRLRATGAGFASSIGRVGAFLGPYVVGAIVGGVGISGVFAMGAISFVVAAVILLIFGPETRGKVLEELSH